MGRRGVCYDNAAAESFFSTIKRELVNRYKWDNADNLRIHLFEWIETWYNSRRLHTSVGMRTPNQVYLDYINTSAA
jgi:transposase InsO family protein